MYNNEKIICTPCKGHGFYTDYTDCCNEPFIGEYPDTDICSDCGEHAIPMECFICSGKGYLTDEEYEEYKFYMEQNKADENIKRQRESEI